MLNTKCFENDFDKSNCQFEIVEQIICEITNAMLYKLKRTVTQEIIIKSAYEIALDKEMVKNLKPEDALSIGYVAGYESYLYEKKIIEKINL